jgi:glutamate 5-kinase
MSLKNSKIVVIKIGSSLLVDENKKVRKKWLSSFAKDIKDLKDKNKKNYNCKFWCYSPWLH